jgi:hypothetical protein
VNHLEAGRAATHFTEAGHMHAVLKLSLLLTREMKKAKCELAAAVAYPNEQVASSAVGRFSKQDLATYETASAGNERADLYELRTVLVAQRQQEQQVLDTMQPEFFEPFCERRPDALQNG